MALADALRTFMYVSLWGKPVLSVARGLSGLIKSMFKAGEQGFAYDPNDLSTLYQDAAGTIPVTAAGQPVGLVLDKSKGLVLGSNVVADPSFNNPAYWSVTTGTSISGGNAIFSGVTSGVGVGKSGITTLGKTYQVTVTVTSIESGALTVMTGRGAGSLLSPNITSAGTYTFLLTALGSLADVRINANSPTATNATVSDISVKELAGNHAYQTNAASRPLLQRNATTGAYYLEFDGTDDFLVTNSIDFTATDKVSLFAGLRKLSDAASGMVFELSSSIGTSNGAFNLAAPSISGNLEYVFSSKGTTSTTARATGYPAPISNVVAAIGDLVQPIAKIRINGVDKQVTILSQGTGKYGNYPLYIGRRGGTTVPFNGHLYSLVGVGRLSTDAETTALEKAIAKNVGVTL